MICPYCGSQNPPNTLTCKKCNARLDFTSPQFAGVSDTPNLRIKNPQIASLIALSLPIALFLLPTLLAVYLLLTGQGDHPLLIPALIGTGLFFIFTVSWLAAWLLGLLRKSQIKAFLTGNRPLLHWRYTPEEWRQIREAEWKESRGDWALQLGCLTLLFGLVGLLAGGMVGLDEGLPEMVGLGLLGGLLGLLAGGAMGVAIGGGNYLAARWAWQQNEPATVALGRHEVYAINQYFRGNGRDKRIRRATLKKGNPSTLLLEIEGFIRPRGPSEEEWLIVVPPRLIEAVEEIIPRLTGQSD